MTEDQIEEMYRLLAIAKYEDRYVIPAAHAEEARDLDELACSLDFDGGPGLYDDGVFGEASGRPTPVAVETFHALGCADPSGRRPTRARAVGARALPAARLACFVAAGLPRRPLGVRLGG